MLLGITGLRAGLRGSLGPGPVEDGVEINAVPVRSGGEAGMGSSLVPLILTSE